MTFDIDSELRYFAAINEASARVTPEMKAAYRRETVAERIQRVGALVYERFDGIVQQGHFAGMRIAHETSWRHPHFAQMVLGVYEQPVTDVLFSPRFADRRVFINVGAADGYYAVGMCHARRMDRAHAFEVNDDGRALIAANAARHGVAHQISVHGAATPEALAALLRDVRPSDAVALVDVDGYEFELLSERILSDYRNCVFVIEIHNWIDDFLSRYRTFLVDAARYFEIQTLSATVRDVDPLSLLADLPDDNRYLLLSEGRPCLMRHLVLSPLDTSCASS